METKHHKTFIKDYSTAPAHSACKWSTEAMPSATATSSLQDAVRTMSAIRSKTRPLRMEKLKLAGMLGEKPDFGFLAECWDDPALQIVIKKLLAKFPQWSMVCVDGALMKWEE